MLHFRKCGHSQWSRETLLKSYVHWSCFRAPILLHISDRFSCFLSYLERINQLLYCLLIDYVKGLIDSKNSDSADRAGQFFTLECFLDCKKCILHKIIAGTVREGFKFALQVCFCRLGARSNCECLVFKIVTTWTVIVKVSSRFIQASNKKTYTIGPFPGSLCANLPSMGKSKQVRETAFWLGSYEKTWINMINAEWTNTWMEKNLPTLITQHIYELADAVVHKSQ